MKNTANVILMIMGCFICLFVIVMIITFWKFGSVPDTLIQYTLGAGGIECLLLAAIKVSKVIKGDANGNSNDGNDV